jgi:hypothetical protein
MTPATKPENNTPTDRFIVASLFVVRKRTAAIFHYWAVRVKLGDAAALQSSG